MLCYSAPFVEVLLVLFVFAGQVSILQQIIELSSENQNAVASVVTMAPGTLTVVEQVKAPLLYYYGMNLTLNPKRVILQKNLFNRHELQNSVCGAIPVFTHRILLYFLRMYDHYNNGEIKHVYIILYIYIYIYIYIIWVYTSSYPWARCSEIVILPFCAKPLLKSLYI